MKKSLLILLAALPFGVMAQQNFTIIGKLKKVQYPAHVYIVYQTNGSMRFDSTTVKNDQFTLAGTVKEPMKAFIALYQRGKTNKDIAGPDQIGVYLENGTIYINSPDTLTHGVLSGTKLNTDQQEMVNLFAPFRKAEDDLNSKYKKAEGDDAQQVKIKEEYVALLNKKEKLQIDFIKKHNGSLVSLNLLRQNFDPAKDLPKARMLFNILTPQLQSLPLAKRYMSVFEKAKMVSIGGIAPDFTMNNTKDQPVSLASYKGKYVLVDFWASWCVPCRKENPNVIKAYEKYKSKNFDVLGVSLDGGSNGKQNWIDAIQKDGLPWEQLSDLQGSNNAVARLYSVNEIPTNFLIDPTGKIVAKNLRGEALEAKLKELL